MVDVSPDKNMLTSEIKEKASIFHLLRNENLGKFLLVVSTGYPATKGRLVSVDGAFNITLLRKDGHRSHFLVRGINSIHEISQQTFETEEDGKDGK